MQIEQIAQVTHEVNRAYCAAIGDNSQVPWAEAPQWQKDSAIAGVTARINGGLTPRQQHEAWLAYKEGDGWIYGQVKNASTKEHPCMVPYDDLPREQQIKDHLFGAVVETCLTL